MIDFLISQLKKIGKENEPFTVLELIDFFYPFEGTKNISIDEKEIVIHLDVDCFSKDLFIKLNGIFFNYDYYLLFGSDHGGECRLIFDRVIGVSDD